MRAVVPLASPDIPDDETSLRSSAVKSVDFQLTSVPALSAKTSTVATTPLYRGR
ncbi:hypothetical protein FBY35_5511 [Streptomyces sp. SLBN-118]|nr:hypothetical protein FBY35_5511 [Streptomyces sp. SLBN-118]